MIISGKELQGPLLETLEGKVNELKKKQLNPQLGIIRLGEDKNDLAYERGIEKSTDRIGLGVRKIVLSRESSTEEVVEAIKTLNEDDSVGGILVFKPLPKSIDEEMINAAIDPMKDVDCISPVNQRNLFIGNLSGHQSATALSALRLLKSAAGDLTGLHVLIINRSLVTGKPLAMMLLNENATVTIAHSRTKDLKSLTQMADVVVTGMGQGPILDRSYFTNKQIIIDCGLSFKEGKMTGDVNYEDVCDLVRGITPVPGGVGALTNGILLESTLKYFEK